MTYELNESQLAETVAERLNSLAQLAIVEMQDNPDQQVAPLSREQVAALHMNYARVDHPEDVSGSSPEEMPEDDLEITASIDEESSDSSIDAAFDHAIASGGDVVITLADGTVLHIDPHQALQIKNSVIGSLQNYLGSIQQFADGTGLQYEQQPDADDVFDMGDSE